MLIKRFYDDKLAQASYLVGCAATGEALVVDANRNIDQYVEAAEEEGLTITHVTETHIHADFLSGSRELAQRTGAKLYLSGEGGPDWQYAFASEAGAQLVHDGDFFMVGNVRIDIWHTPGHTPEHLSFVVTDTVAADRPMGAFTGDFIFVGDVGRPDLLERAANVEGTMVAGARQLHASLTRFAAAMPDYLQIWPGHGAGSACGKALGAVPSSTLGYEKLFNRGFAFKHEADFVNWVLAGQPEPPRYFAQMKRLNKEGPAILGGLKLPPRVAESQLADLLAQGKRLVDVRHPGDFALGHIPGSLNIPLTNSFNTWAGWLLPYDQDIYLLANAPEDVAVAVRDLAAIGLDRVAGYLDQAALDVYSRDYELETVSQITADQLAQAADVLVVDVRGQTEYEAGHLPQATHIPLGYLADRSGELPKDKRIVLHCAAGGRAAIAASVLQAKGFRRLEVLRGGFEHWRATGHPVAKGELVSV